MDTKLIDGYESMTPEQKIEALEKFDESEILKKLRQTVSDVNSENKKLKDQIKANASGADELTQLKSMVAEQQKMLERNKNSARLQKLGINCDDADELSDSINGVSEEYFSKLDEVLKKRDEALKEQLLKGQPSPTSGQPPKGKTDDDKFFEAFKLGAGV